MLKFKDYEYKRPDLKAINQEFEELMVKFNNAETFDEQNEIMAEINRIRSNVDTMGNLVYIRHSVNTLDEFYSKEQDFLDENMPIYQNIVSEFYKALVNSTFCI
ncbi:hypothetical protein [Schnuerera ultunensis]|uniref:Uncharacterized protein n=1 Tax=[Clostridium] ultunense Esp TaxID=1288971 RepID=A0A1M4PMJ1_9FIRM|nr:hypothetical protein [Schnuerera ultunensis]SHD76711.1 protein of unknown function [[Clostridium] ultunense Esp]